MLRRTTGSVSLRKRSSSTRKIRPIFIVLLLIILSAPALAETRPGSFSVSPFVGGYLFEGNQELKHRPVYGVRGGYDFTEHWGAELLLGYGRTYYKPTDASTDVFHYRLEGLYHFLPAGKLNPFLAAGFGGMTIDSRDARPDKDFRATAGYGAGLKYSLTDQLAIRADVRHVLASGSTHHNLEYTLGLVFYFGGPKAASARAVPEMTPAVLPDLSAPANLTAAPVSDSRINLDWNAVSGATGYKVYRDGSYLTASRTASLPDTGLKADTRYCYTVSATDDRGRESGRSNQACATTFKAAAGAGERMQAAATAVTPETAYALEDIHFDFDKFNLKPEAREILKRHATWLNSNPAVTLAILVEGHCDERGTAEYNMALGERRANAAARYLIDLGVDAKRITTISYGFERPVDPRHSEEAWAKNRRAHFVVTGTTSGKK